MKFPSLKGIEAVGGFEGLVFVGFGLSAGI